MIMMAPEADKVLPAFGGLLLEEPVPHNGRLKVSEFEKPGFGVELNPQIAFTRPYAR
jgi:L-rhamnonate dehydratase